MTPKQAKLAYFLFFSCFAVWLALILSVCFPSGRWTTPIIFPNYFMLALFIGSAVLSSIQAMLIGLHFLGMNFKIRKGKQNSSSALPSIRTRKYELRPVSTSPKDSIKKTETKKPQNHVKNKKDNSKYKSTGKRSLLIKQNNGTTEIASVNMKTNQKDNSKSKDRMKAFFLFGETEFDHCAYELGYLKGLPKNKPIPDECFGCPEILTCIALTRKQVDDQNTVVISQG